MRVPTRAFTAVLGFTIVVSAASSSVEAASPFEGRTIEYVVGTKQGGGYDSYARLIAPFLEKHLPGTTVVVLNKPAGGGVAALRELSRRTDGTMIMTLNNGLLLAQIGGLEELDVDLSTLSWIGKADSEARFLLGRVKAELASFGDLSRAGKPFLCAAAAPSSAAAIQTRLIIESFGLNARVLTGFAGAEAEAALAKDETDCVLTSESNVHNLLVSGIANALARIGEPEGDLLSNVPLLASIATTEAQRLIVRRIEVLSALGRLTAAAPNAPQDEVSALRAAYAAALSDPELLARAAKQNMPLHFLPGEQVSRLVAEFLDTNEEFRAAVKRTVPN